MQLKILTYNIHKGFNWRNSELTIKKIKDALKQTDADIVFLQEIVGENKIMPKKHKEWIDAQHEYLADSIWNDYAYAKNAVYDHRHHGNAILSRFPIKSWDQLDISTNKREQRGILACDIETPRGMLHTFCVHLDLFHKGRSIQYKKINEFINDRCKAGDPKILAGDFNDWNQAASTFLKDFQEASKLLHGRYQKTFPVHYPILRLDRIYVKGIHPFQVQTLTGKQWRSLSDHSPIYMAGEAQW